MKILHSIALYVTAFIALAMSGCTTVPGGTVRDQGPSTVRLATSTGAILELYRNPDSMPAAVELSTSIEHALAGEAILTPEIITKFVRQVCEKNHVHPINVAVYVNLALNVYRTYADAHPAVVVRITDPTVRLYVKAFQDGLNDAIASFRPATA